MRTLLLLISITFSVVANAQTWKRITANFSFKSGYELRRFRETYQMFYYSKRLDLENRPFSDYWSVGFGYNFVFSENLIINPSLQFTHLNFNELRQNSLTFESSIYYSFSGKMDAPLMIDFAYTPSSSIPAQFAITLGFASSGLYKLWNPYFEEEWKERKHFWSIAPCLTIQDGLYWGIKLESTFSAGMFSNSKVKDF
ncbi:MAG: hypothetical protein ACPGLV_15240 [Bacteroidia bacterium]